MNSGRKRKKTVFLAARNEYFQDEEEIATGEKAAQRASLEMNDSSQRYFKKDCDPSGA